MDSDRDLKDLIKEAADMEDAIYEESFSLNLEDQEQSNNYQITNGDQEAQEELVVSQKRQGKSRGLQPNRLSSQDPVHLNDVPPALTKLENLRLAERNRRLIMHRATGNVRLFLLIIKSDPIFQHL